MSSSIDADSFAALCERLRKSGAVKVEGHGFSATFVPQAPLPTAPRPGPQRPAREVPTDDADMRELLRKRELGLV